MEIVVIAAAKLQQSKNNQHHKHYIRVRVENLFNQIATKYTTHAHAAYGNRRMAQMQQKIKFILPLELYM